MTWDPFMEAEKRRAQRAATLRGRLQSWLERYSAGLLIAVIVAVIAGMTIDASRSEVRILRKCRADVVAHGFDLEDVAVFNRQLDVGICDMASSSSLRRQYERWRAGEISIDPSARLAREARDAARSAETMSAISIGISASAAARPK